ncbi:uncharacterized protein LAJ45_08030 [Morchella importuna]|uniref:uncharacterized protein n=1 Tax=Morchella importuna TaxID=1174673 RepID=UPI001E8EBC9C|nr:uncharacterized protein LAJ45_08030 [Morchella importuna]KAH8147929.1 hypothetical protein LAJ45_08030 [Morchella importuna]
MSSNVLSLSNNTKSTQILYYTYLLLHKNGTVLPLVSAADLPSTITVLPPTGPGTISLLQEISHPRFAPEVLETTPAPAVAFTPQNPHGLVQYQGQGRETQSSGCEKSATTPAGILYSKKRMKVTMGAIKLGLALTSREGLAAGVGKTVSTFTPLPRRKCTKTLETAQPVSIGGKWRREESEEVVAEKEENEEECNNEVRDKKDSPTPPQHIKTHCTFFLRFGECDYWPTCKFSHERPEGSWRSSSRKLTTTFPQRRSGSNSISGSELYEEKPREVRVGKLISY